MCGKNLEPSQKSRSVRLCMCREYSTAISEKQAGKAKAGIGLGETGLGNLGSSRPHGFGGKSAK